MANDVDVLEGAGNDGGNAGSQGISAPPKKILMAVARKPKLSPGQIQDALTPASSVPPGLGKPYDPSQPVYGVTDSPSSKGTPAENGSEPSAQDTSSAGVAAPAVDRGLSGDTSANAPGSQNPFLSAATKPAEPTLAPQGSKNPILRVLQRITGMVAPQPAPGEMYSGPTTTEGKLGALGKFLGKVGERGELAYGSALDRETLLQQKAIEAQRLGHLAQLSETARWHDITGGIQQQKADVAQQRADQAAQKDQAAMRVKGYVPDESGAGYRVMKPEEILSDPFLSQNYDVKRTAQNVQTLRGALYQAQTAALTDPNNPLLHAKLQNLQNELKFHQDQMSLALMRLQQGAQGLNLRTQEVGLRGAEAGLKQYQPALDAQLRLKTMRQNYQDGLKGDQQAMVSLLMNHIGMTLGAQKGARMTKDVIHEAAESLPWLDRVRKSFDENGVLSGITLAPEQMKQMLGLGEQRYRDTVASSRAGAQYLGITEEPQWDIDPDSPISGPSGVPAPIQRAIQPNAKRKPNW